MLCNASPLHSEEGFVFVLGVKVFTSLSCVMIVDEDT